jgi:hypothetical protein
MRCRTMLYALAAGLFAIAGGSASATPYALDTFLFSANLGNSGDALETSTLNHWLSSAPGYAHVSATFDYKVDSASSLVVSNGTAGQWYLDLAPSTPGFFLLKFGTGNTGFDDTYYFENLADLSKLVWENSQVNFLTGGDCAANNQKACNIGRLSHYTTFQDPVGGVPEPGSLALCGLSLAALAVFGRRRSLFPGRA